jgi:hypothetical protein
LLKSISSIDKVPLADVLKQISAELMAIADTVGAVEETVSRIANGGGAKDYNMMRDLQNIDMISQSLKAIASYSDCISQNAPEDWEIDTSEAAKSVLLTDLARRLSCAPRQVDWGNSSRSGEWEVFD